MGIRSIGSGGEDPDLLDERASSAFDGLVAPDLDKLERGRALRRHPPRRALIMRMAGHEPSVTPEGDTAQCLVTVLAMIITAGWQVAAVSIAASQNLDVSSLDPRVLGVGVVVSILVVAFDWHMITDIVHGRRPGRVWIVRLGFVASMTVLVSESLASAYFAPDIERQLALDGHVHVGQTITQLEELQRRRKEIQDQASKLTAVAATYLKQRNSVRAHYNSLASAGVSVTECRQARAALESAQQQYYSAVSQRDNPVTGTPALNAQVRSLQVQIGELKKAGDNIAASPGGAAAREAALWRYLIANPGALTVRIPLFFVCAFLDVLALVIGSRISPETRAAHIDWLADRDEVRRLARTTSGAILAEMMKRVSLIINGGLHGRAEQEALAARMARMIREAQFEEQQHRRYNEGRRHASGGRRSSGSPSRRSAAKETVDLSDSRSNEQTGSRSEQEDVFADVVAGAGAITGTEVFSDAASQRMREESNAGQDMDGFAAGFVGDEFHDEPSAGSSRSEDNYPSIREDRRVRFIRPSVDPGYAPEYLDPYLKRHYGTGEFHTFAVEPLPKVALDVGRATLLRGIGPEQARTVIKLFAAIGPAGSNPREFQHHMSRDAVNASKMSSLDSPWPAPSQFGTTVVEGQPVSYLVMPYYPAGSVFDYVREHQDHQRSLEWCLVLCEKMLQACADLARRQIVACDAKLANFVLSSGPGQPVLTPEIDRAIGMSSMDPYTWPDPRIRIIDLSMVFFRAHGEHDPNTRPFRGTHSWSSPRALNTGADGTEPFMLSSLDDLYSVSVNTMYLFTLQSSRGRYGRRCDLEALAPEGEPSARKLLRDLSEALAAWADERSNGVRAEDWLRTGRDWLRREYQLPAEQVEERACELAATYVRRIRESLPEPVRRTQFLNLTWAPTSGEPEEPTP